MNVGNGQGQGRYHITAEINMIPLIDVALVLLIIFMVISPILVESQMRVNLPKVSQSSAAEETALKVEIAADGTIAFQGKLLTLKSLENEMRRFLPPGHRASILVQADKDVAFNHVVRVMDIAKKLKIQKLGVSVIPELVSN